MPTQIYLGTILLEPQRWSRDKEPSYAVSAWLERIKAAGFDGIELWENHYVKTDAAERELLRAKATTLAIYNAYAGLEAENAHQRAISAQNATELGAQAMKFNVGSDAARLDEYVTNAAAWADLLPKSTQLWCECHPGTALETPQAAARAFDIWDEARFGVMIHPFTTEPQILRDWLRLLGPRVRHSHVQIRDADGRPTCLDTQPEMVRAALEILRDEGFAGSFTMEFTLGTSTAHDQSELLWPNALRDLAFLRDNWQ